MSKLTGAALDRAVANALGLKSVNNCEQWGKEMKFKRQWVDPAEGWKYGFPKIYDSDTDGTMEEWLLKNGYPKSMIQFPIRYWLAVAEDEESVVKIQLDKQDNV